MEIQKGNRKNLNMRIILLLPSNHIYANFMVKEIIKRSNRYIAMIIESDSLIPERSFWYSIKKYITTAGFKYFFIQAIKQISFTIGKFIARYLLIIQNDKNLFYSYKKIAARYNIPVIKVDDINGPLIMDTIKGAKPDLIISVYFRQILKEQILQLPEKGCLNIHPALLPFYRGVSPIFWALANGEQNVGVTIHFINKEIDQGDIIIQRTIPIKREDTEHRLFLKCSAIAIPMLLESIKRIENYPFVRIKQEKDGSYFSLPTKDAVRAFKRRGHKVLKIKDFLDGEKIVSDFIQC